MLSALHPFLLRYFFRLLVVVAPDQLPRRGDPNPAKDSVCLTDINLFRRKINVRVQIPDFSVWRLGIRPFGQGQRNLGISDINRVQEWLMLQQRGIIDV